jgi:hypothetical protein
MVSRHILGQNNFCASCGEKASLVVTDSVELRHTDFEPADVFLRYPALGLTYTTEQALQAVIDRLNDNPWLFEDYPWLCDLWKARGSTTMGATLDSCD